LAEVPAPLRTRPGEDEAARWIEHPARLLQVCDAAVQRFAALPAATPSLRLLAEQAAEALAGIAQALGALALLVADPARPVARIRGRRFPRMPDWLPPLSNAGRAFVVIVVAELFWIITAWPGGANAITFAAIIVILFAPCAEQAYAIAMGFMIGSVLSVIIVATLLFAVRCGELQGYGMFVCLAAAAYFHSTIIAGISLFVVLLIVNDLFMEGGYSNLAPYSPEVFGVRMGARASGLGQAANGGGKILGPLSLALIAGTGNVVAPQATKVICLAADTSTSSSGVQPRLLSACQAIPSRSWQ
jgi:hypothetical protein